MDLAPVVVQHVCQVDQEAGRLWGLCVGLEEGGLCNLGEGASCGVTGDIGGTGRLQDCSGGWCDGEPLLWDICSFPHHSDLCSYVEPYCGVITFCHRDCFTLSSLCLCCVNGVSLDLACVVL